MRQLRRFEPSPEIGDLWLSVRYGLTTGRKSCTNPVSFHGYKFFPLQCLVNRGDIEFALNYIEEGSFGSTSETVHEKSYHLLRLLVANHFASNLWALQALVRLSAESSFET